LRKNVEIWKKWGANDGNNLHGYVIRNFATHMYADLFSLQLRILDRAMRMLKPGGRLVYSTCSFNPLENEAVVAAALNAYPGQSSRSRWH
jgi:multisite-specific tRNA:(cytosine-C5)-methyltransferase